MRTVKINLFNYLFHCFSLKAYLTNTVPDCLVPNCIWTQLKVSSFVEPFLKFKIILPNSCLFCLGVLINYLRVTRRRRNIGNKIYTSTDKTSSLVFCCDKKQHKNFWGWLFVLFDHRKTIQVVSMLSCADHQN